MKKIILVAAIVCVAAVSQAASWTWSTNTGVLKDGYGKATDSSYTPVALGNTVTYLFLAGNASDTKSTDDLNATLTALRAGTAVTEIAGYTGVSATTDANGKITTASAVTFDFDAGTVLDEKAYFYEVVLNSDGDYAFISGLTGATTADAGKTGGITTGPGPSVNLRDSTGTASYGSAGWYAVPVPEPTSGLLLLIGMGTLALRRKRA